MAMAGHSLVNLTVKGLYKIILVGGLMDNDGQFQMQVMNRLWVFDVATWTWDLQQIEGNIPDARYNAATCSDVTGIAWTYMFGGMNGNDKFRKEIPQAPQGQGQGGMYLEPLYRGGRGIKVPPVWGRVMQVRMHLHLSCLSRRKTFRRCQRCRWYRLFQ